MQEPCASCPRRDQDFGGCRCQAFALTGDAAATDPVAICQLIARMSPRWLRCRMNAPYLYRRM